MRQGLIDDQPNVSEAVADDREFVYERIVGLGEIRGVE
jgi:hypothetical protein